LATLSKRPVIVDFYSPENGDWNSHVDLGIWADVMIVAPATANTIAKMANGIADNLLLTTYLSAKCPVFFAPTMDLDMYNHQATQRNIQTLKERGHICIDAETGELASGLIGKGRMAEPEEIYRQIDLFFSRNHTFENKTILVTAGPTYESIDPVRFIGNYSSGKMGYALAKEFIRRGARVILISGPVAIKPPKGTELFKVVSANEMYDECIRHFTECDITVMCAAVADFTPKIKFDNKVKREKDNLNIELKPTRDIASKLGEMKKKDQILIGFALETDNEFENAYLKLKKKNMDFIVLNSLKDEGAGFNHDTNKISIIDSNNNITKFELKSKKEIASDIINELAKYIEIENA
jgi:phosphopantothenoylcysteine decarboxylase / phosphopantothenate---cysteine ligase